MQKNTAIDVQLDEFLQSAHTHLPTQRTDRILPALQEPRMLPSAHCPCHPTTHLTAQVTLACLCGLHAVCTILCFPSIGQYSSMNIARFIHVVCIVVDQQFSTFLISWYT